MERELTRTTTHLHGGNNGSEWTKRVSWSAVLAGVLVATVFQIMLTLLGLGVGFGSINPVSEANPTAGLGIGGAIWYVISSLTSMLLGGWVAGRLAGAPHSFDGVIHGILTWSLVTMLTLYLLTSTLGSIIGGAGQLVGGLVKTAGSAAASAAPGLGNMVQDQLRANGIDTDNLDLKSLQDEVTKTLRQTGDPALNPNRLENQAKQAGKQVSNAAGQAASNPQAGDDMAGNLFGKLFKQGQSTVSQIDREDAVNVLMKRSGKSRAESEKTVDNWISTYKQASVKFDKAKRETEVQARHVAEDAANAASRAALFGFLGLVLGAAVAGYGAKLGTESQEDYNRREQTVTSVNR